MTNLQEGSQQGSSFVLPAMSLEDARQRLMWLLLLALGGVVGVLLLLLWVIPALQRLHATSERLAQEQQKLAQLPLLRQQVTKTLQAQRRVERQRSQLLALIAGSGQLATFLAQVDREAQRHRVQLDVLQPAPPPAATPAKRGNAAQPAPPPPAPSAEAKGLAGTGMEATRMTLVARGDFPNLLAFLRAMERLSLLVVQSDLQLKVPERQSGTGQQPAAVQPVSFQPGDTELRLELGLYRAKAEAPRPGR